MNVSYTYIEPDNFIFILIVTNIIIITLKIQRDCILHQNVHLIFKHELKLSSYFNESYVQKMEIQ